jgi:hypothetical protein
MKTLEQINNILSEKKDYLKENYFVSLLGIFGSYSRGCAIESSDIDILVEFSRRIDFIRFMKLEEYLTNLLECKTDLVTIKALKPLIKDKILEQTIYI